MVIECPEHGTMLNYGNHGDITIYRCEQVWGTHREIWVHKNGNQIEVELHLYLKSTKGQQIKNKLAKEKHQHK